MIKLQCWHKDRECFLETFYVVVSPYFGKDGMPSQEVYEDWLAIDEREQITDDVILSVREVE